MVTDSTGMSHNAYFMHLYTRILGKILLRVEGIQRGQNAPQRQLIYLI
uniref:Uncharacterized protein n=1 Tax=Anguilla anguilla TaxID=7936 RepID=A0A0E9WLP0_ANGAN